MPLIILKKLLKTNLINSMQKILVFVSVILTVLISCETIVEIDLPEKEPVITVNSLFVPFTPPYPQQFKVELTSSVPILDTSNYKTIIPDATVYLFENNEIIDTLEYIDTAEYYVSSVFPQTGKNYRLEVSKAGFNNVTCSDIVPERVCFDTATVINYGGLDSNGEPFSEITLSFSDPAGVVNYYEIAVSRAGSYNDYFYLSANDEIITSESYYPSILMFDARRPQFLPYNDIKINETPKELKIFYMPPYMKIIDGNNESTYINSHIIDIHFRSVSENYYKFRTSYLQHLNNKRGDGLFGMNEPINVYTNVENGYGIFAGYQEDIITLQVEGIQIQ